jgi:hypothetical protein
MRRHRDLLILALLIGGATSLPAQTPAPAGGATPGALRALPSGRATSEVTLVPVDSAARAAAQPARIRVDYGQPHLRGRTLHTDSLVPYDQPWRTGANDPTTLTTDVDLVVGGATLPKGRYVLQTLPTRAGWKLLVQKFVETPPTAEAMAYDPANDLARVDLRQSTLPAPLESLSIWLVPSTQPGAPRGELRLAWGTVALATDWSVR